MEWSFYKNLFSYILVSLSTSTHKHPHTNTHRNTHTQIHTHINTNKPSKCKFPYNKIPFTTKFVCLSLSHFLFLSFFFLFSQATRYSLNFLPFLFLSLSLSLFVLLSFLYHSKDTPDQLRKINFLKKITNQKMIIDNKLAM